MAHKGIRKFIWLFLTVIIITALILTGCNGGSVGEQEEEEEEEEEEPEIVNPGIFTYATIGPPDSLDPAYAYDTASGEIIQSVYETLIFWDGESTTEFVPALMMA
jgi:ABC-type oligopeptide transport system substrate-binding subunit